MDMKTNFNIGKRIHELRIDSGLSQEKLALRAEITTTYLGLLERNPLNISLNDFFSPSHAPEKPVDTASLQILAQISDRSEEEKLLILQTIKDILRLCDLSKKEYEKG